MLMQTDPIGRLEQLFEQTRGNQTAPMDAYRLGDVITVNFDLPGVEPENIDLEIERGELRLRAERKAVSPDGARFLMRERTSMTISRRVMLGELLDVDHVDAEFEGGVLTLRIPLHESAKPRQISINKEGSRSSPKAIDVDSS